MLYRATVVAPAKTGNGREMKIVVLVHGLPGSGKTTVSEYLAGLLGAARINADYVRENINRGLTFSLDDRVEQAHRIAHITNLALTGKNRVAVVDFINPTPETRAAFLGNIHYRVVSIWMDTLQAGRFEDTNSIYQPPTELPDSVEQLRVQGWKTLNELKQFAAQTALHIRELLGSYMRRYHIRFNTRCNQDPTIPQKWRIFDVETGQERLATGFHISSSQVVPGLSYDENGVEKWNIEIHAAAYWEGEHVNFMGE